MKSNGKSRIDAHGHIRAFTPRDTSVPFVAQRTPREIEEALAIIQREELFFWYVPKQKPSELTDEMIADAENTLGVKLPASYLAILKMQNGGSPYKGSYGPNSFYSPSSVIPRLFGIAPGQYLPVSLQEVPHEMWYLLEGYLDDNTYQELRDTFKSEIHPDWGREPRITEMLVLVSHDVHWGIALNYVRCGRQGEPSVVRVEMEGPPGGEEILTELAPDFMTFLRQSYKGSDKYVYGFVNVKDKRKLKNSLKHSLGVRFKKVKNCYSGGFFERIYVATTERWRGDISSFPTNMWLEPNKHRLPEPYSRFQTNLKFALHPECNWILQVSIHKDEREELESLLAKTPYQVVPLHTPPGNPNCC